MQKFFIAVVASVFVLSFAGCGKHTAASTQSSEQPFNAVQFCNDFASAPPELKTLADKAWRSIQTAAFPAALDSLGKLQANSALDESQKKSVAALTAQVQKQMATNVTAR